MVQATVGGNGDTLRRAAKVRLRWLVAAHASLAMLPAVNRLLPWETRYLGEGGQLFDWALKGLLLAQLTLVAFWVGLGTNRIGWRISAAAVSCVYLAFWQTIGGCAPRLIQFGLGPGRSPEDVSRLSWDAFPQNVMHSAGAIGIFCAIFAAAFLIVRRWFNELEWMAGAQGIVRDRAIQYAGFAMLAMTVNVALPCIARREMNLADPLGWHADASTACVAFPFNAMCAVWATLVAGRIRWRVLLAFLLAASTAVSIWTGGYSAWFGAGLPYGATIGAWRVLRWVIVSLLPLVILIGSLLTVRTCGFFLARHVAIRRQFALRELLAAFTLGCAALAFVVVPAEKQRRAVAALEIAGGSVKYRQNLWEPDETFWRMFPANGLRRLLPRDHYDEVESVTLDYAEITDPTLVHLRVLSDLQSLSLNGNPITDVALSHMRGLKRLEGLNLFECPITDGGLANLRELTQLQYLDLSYTEITDAGMIELESLTKIKELQLSGTQITDAGLARLFRATTLEGLSLRNTLITDAGLRHLERLTRLHELRLEGCLATEAGVARLREVLPKASVSGP